LLFFSQRNCYNRDMDNLSAKKCVPCEKGTPPLNATEAEKHLSQLENRWEIVENKKIFRRYKFKTFVEAIDFVNKVARIAEEEGHHPDIIIRYNRVTIELTTHVIHGLSENDFIIADKIDVMYNLNEIIEQFVISKFFTIKVVGTIVVILALLLLWKRFL